MDFRRRNYHLILVSVAAAAFTAGCPGDPPGVGDGGGGATSDGGGDGGAGCVPDLVRGVNLVVTDAETGTRICNATVVASLAGAAPDAGDSSEALVAYGPAGSCLYYGLFNRAGTFTLSATRAGYLDGSTTVTVVVDACGEATTVDATIALEVDPAIFVDAGVDAGPPGDDGGVDGGPLDGGAEDAGVVDAGANDAGSPDAGANDAGSPDAGANDAGTPDAGANDAGSPDAGANDAGAADGGL